MRIFRHYEDLPHAVAGAVVALGNFDGVHRGHQAVIGEALRHAEAVGAPKGVVTFEPHPRVLFQPDQPPFRLTPFRIKARHIEALGVDALFVLHFDKDFATLSAEDFVRKVLVEGLKVRHVVVGYDYVFGRGRKGDVAMLSRLAAEHGFGVTRVEALFDQGGEIYSSTRTRDFLLAGQPRQAAAILGRCWEIEGRVEHGDARGRQLGFPTANLHLGEYQQPATGVYAVRAGIDRGGETKWMDGVANLGQRPTFDGQGVVLEVHLLDFSGDLYGQHLRVCLVEHLRSEMRFAGLDALKHQIEEDCARARAVLASGACR